MKKFGIANFNKFLQKFNMSISQEPFNCLKRLSSPVSLFQAWNSFKALRSIHWNMKKIRKNENLKFYPKVTQTEVKNIDHIPLALETMQQLIIKPCCSSQGPCHRRKFKNVKKMQIF